MLEAQAAYLDHLVETVTAESVDLVLVAGDVYDRALPPVDAIELAGDALARLAALGVRTVVTSGNHDSAIRLGVNARLADAAGVHLRTRWQDVGTPGARRGPPRRGGGPRHPLPRARRRAPGVGAAGAQPRGGARPRRCSGCTTDLDAPRRSVGRDGARVRRRVPGGSRDDALRQRARHLRRRAADRADLAVHPVPATSRSATCTARPTLTDSIRYSGSPLAYSFSEADQAKGSWLVELGPGRRRARRLRARPGPPPAGRVRGRLDDLLHDPALADAGGRLARGHPDRRRSGRRWRWSGCGSGSRTR